MDSSKQTSFDRAFAKRDASIRQVGHSNLYRWMHRHRFKMKARIEHERPDWVALADAFAELGLMDRTGKPATAETARKTWYQVRKAMLKADETPPVRKTRKEKYVLAQGELAQGVRWEVEESSPRRVSSPQHVPLADLPLAPPLDTERQQMPKPKFRNQIS